MGDSGDRIEVGGEIEDGDEVEDKDKDETLGLVLGTGSVLVEARCMLASESSSLTHLASAGIKVEFLDWMVRV